jgi:hypothetical protein
MYNCRKIFCNLTKLIEQEVIDILLGRIESI